MAGPPSGESRGQAQDPAPLLLLLVVQKRRLGSRSLYLVRPSPRPRMAAGFSVSVSCPPFTPASHGGWVLGLYILSAVHPGLAWRLGSRSLYLVRRSPQPRMHALLLVSRAPLVPQLVKNPPAMWEPWVRPMGWEDPLEKGKATHSSVLAWRTPWTLVRGVAESGMSEQLSLSL